jgi:flagellar biosynthesis protein FlhG
VDRDSIAVCKCADDVILVVETDTTSFQATQHLIDILSLHNLTIKVRGFIINKVIDDPTQVARSGTAVFRAQYLSAIPFDIKATREFLIGEVPGVRSLFGIHVWQALFKLYPDKIAPPQGRTLSFEEYRELNFGNLDSVRGGVVVAIGILIWATGLGFWFASNSKFIEVEVLISGYYSKVFWAFVAVSILGLLGSFERTRRVLGRTMNLYIQVLRRLLISERE